MSLVIEKILAGDGKTKPKSGQTVSLHYICYLESGMQIDSSRARKQPYKFQLKENNVIKGIYESIKTMSKGERVKAICPPEFCYGNKGHPGLIPKDSTLVFDLQLLDVE